MKSRILVVEEDPKILYNLEILLKFNDYIPFTATNGVEALKVLFQFKKPPNLVLCDIVMPR